MLNFPSLKTLVTIKLNFNHNNNRRVEVFSGKGNTGFPTFSNLWQIKSGDLNKKALPANLKNDLSVLRPALEFKPRPKK